MTTQEAITQLHELIQDRESFMVGEYESYLDRDKQALQTAIKALEKQIPKKPIEENPWVFSCPNCGSGNVEEWCLNRHNCCPDCGQALDWRNGNATN
jgi:predicted RNA-binding Zn-ribbon protein involved in translation (DUF1610 family)